MRQYLSGIRHILNTGEWVENRTGEPTLSVFGYQMQLDLSREGFPAVTTKKLPFKSVSAELLWFLEGSTDERRLAELTYQAPRSEIASKNTIWTANADHQGKRLGYMNDSMTKKLGPIYGSQWRGFNKHSNLSGVGKDQVLDLFRMLREEPESRRIILTAWNPVEIERMALPPCHVLSQFRVLGGRLHLHLFQRSADAFLGVPFNIASYALLLELVARETPFKPGKLVHSISDFHLYESHIEPAKTMLKREPRSLPTLKIDNTFDLMKGLQDGFPLDSVSKISLEGYDPHPAIKASMAV